MNKTKALGQHFLNDRSILRKILNIIDPQKDELVIEIGAGKGALTFPLAEQAGKVLAIEKDADLIPFLKENGPKNLIVIERDVLEVDFRELVALEPGFRGRVKIAGNLPYSISSPLLFKIFEDRELFAACVFLLQKEVAQRLAARPGSKSYAPLSILFQLVFDVRLCLPWPRGLFSSAQVQSASYRSKRPVPFSKSPMKTYSAASPGRLRPEKENLANNLKSWPQRFGPVQEALLRLGLRETVRAGRTLHRPVRGPFRTAQKGLKLNQTAGGDIKQKDDQYPGGKATE
jgi:16S rRNA (adenine1518-N6/adenine1519-N6)-dimethyltransferase